MTDGLTVTAPAQSAAAAHDRPRHAGNGDVSGVAVSGAWRVLVPVAAWTLVLYLLTFLVVRRHYALFLPHYDSIGSYSSMFQIVNDVQDGKLTTVLRAAVQGGMTWLQPAYALLLAWAPVKAPEWLVSLNFVLLLVAQAAIITYGRTVGFSPLRQGVAALLPIIPGSMYAWDGGVQDLRRDIQLVVLALAILFLTLAYVLHGTWQRGVALGLVVGMAQWSRDNAAAVILIVALPALVLAVARSRQAGGVAALVRLGLLPMAVFLLVAIPYYGYSLPSTIARYTTSVWGVGESRLESLEAWWNVPFSTLFGGDYRISGRLRTALATAMLLGGAVAAFGLLRRLGVVAVRPSRLRQPGFALLLAGGAWVVVAVLLYNTLLLGYGARWHGVPFVPIMVGLVAIMVGMLGAVTRAPGAAPRQVALAIGVGGAVLLLSAPARMLLNEQPPFGAESVAAVRAAAIEIAQRADGRPVAFLSYDRFSRHHVQYYLSQADIPSVANFVGTARAHGDYIDLDRPLRANEDPNELRQQLDRTIRAWADFALVLTDTSRYADPRELLWPYQYGKPVIDGLLADPNWQQVATYELVERSYVLLQNNGPRPARAGMNEPSAAATTRDAAVPTPLLAAQDSR